MGFVWEIQRRVLEEGREVGPCHGIRWPSYHRPGAQTKHLAGWSIRCVCAARMELDLSHRPVGAAGASDATYMLRCLPQPASAHLGTCPMRGFVLSVRRGLPCPRLAAAQAVAFGDWALVDFHGGLLGYEYSRFTTAPRKGRALAVCLLPLFIFFSFPAVPHPRHGGHWQGKQEALLTPGIAH